MDVFKKWKKKTKHLVPGEKKGKKPAATGRLFSLMNDDNNYLNNCA